MTAGTRECAIKGERRVGRVRSVSLCGADVLAGVEEVAAICPCIIEQRTNENKRDPESIRAH